MAAGEASEAITQEQLAMLRDFLQQGGALTDDMKARMEARGIRADELINASQEQLGQLVTAANEHAGAQTGRADEMVRRAEADQTRQEGRATSLEERAGEFTAEQQQRLQPLEQEFGAQAGLREQLRSEAEITPERIGAAQGRATADVERQFELAGEERRREAMRRGVDPSSPQWQAMERDIASQRATARAGASDVAGREERAMRTGLAQGVTAQGQSGLGMAVTGTQAAGATELGARESAAGIGQAAGTSTQQTRAQAADVTGRAGEAALGARERQATGSLQGSQVAAGREATAANLVGTGMQAQASAIGGFGGAAQTAQQDPRQGLFGVPGLQLRRGGHIRPRRVQALRAPAGGAVPYEQPRQALGMGTGDGAGGPTQDPPQYAEAREIPMMRGPDGVFRPPAERGADMGGHLTGPGTETSDSIDAEVSHDEYINPAFVTKTVGTPVLDAIVEAARGAQSGDPAARSDVMKLLRTVSAFRSTAPGQAPTRVAGQAPMGGEMAMARGGYVRQPIRAQAGGQAMFAGGQPNTSRTMPPMRSAQVGAPQRPPQRLGMGAPPMPPPAAPQRPPVRAAQGGILDEILRQQGDEAQASNPQATRPMLDWQDTESGAAGASSPQGQAPPAPGGPDFMGGMSDILMERRGQPTAQGPYRSSIRRGVELAGKAMGMGAARGGRVSNRRQALFAGLSQQGNREGLSQRR
jgi:hypothetical protein